VVHCYLHPADSFAASYYFSSFKTRSYHDHSRTTSSMSIRSIGWNPPGNRIACALSDKLVRVWNPDKPEIQKSTELRGHTAPVAALAWDPTHSDRLASCGSDRTVRFWDYRAKVCLATVDTGGENIAIVWHPDGGTVVVATRVSFFWWAVVNWLGESS
jgi:THO complex subunit 3